MAEVVIPSAWEKQELINNLLKEYIRKSAFDAYMGTDSTNVFVVISEDQTEGGKPVNIPLIQQIKGAGVRGSTALEGNETDLNLANDRVFTDWRRNAVKVPKSTSYKTDIDILNAARPLLRDWAAIQVLRADIVTQLDGIVIPGTAAVNGNTPDTVVSYTAATASQRNTFIVNNADRVLFGNNISNASSGVMATALGNISGTTDKLSTVMISKARRIAQATVTGSNPSITPYMTEDGEEWYVLFVNPRQMRDLRADAVMTQANRDAMQRGKDNPLFRAGDLLWEGVIIREVQELPVIAGAGASGVDVAQAFLAGQSAIAIAYGQQPRVGRNNTQDYEFRPAVFIEELIGIKKTSFNGIQYGGVSIFTAATADT